MNHGSFSWGKFTQGIYPGHIENCTAKVYLIKNILLSQLYFYKAYALFGVNVNVNVAWQALNH